MDIYTAILWIFELRSTHREPPELDLPHAGTDRTKDTTRHLRLAAGSSV